MNDGAIDMDKVVFHDAEESYTAPQGTSIKEIVMTHISRIGHLSTKEFRPGRMEKRPVRVGDSVFIIETWKEDTRDSYINAVDFLHHILLPKFDKEATEAFKEIEKQIDKDRGEVKEEEAWKNKRLEHRIRIFKELNLLLSRLDYLDTGYIAD